MKTVFLFLTLCSIVAATSAIKADAQAKFIEHYIQHVRKPRSLEANVHREWRKGSHVLTSEDLNLGSDPWNKLFRDQSGFCDIE